MKKIFYGILTFALFHLNAIAQPKWFKDIQVLPPDSNTTIVPVKIINAGNLDVVVVSNYYNSMISGAIPTYINVARIDTAGNTVWNFIYSTNLPTANDISMDATGSFYIVGSTMGMLNSSPLMFKLSSSGSLIWSVGGSQNVTVGNYQKIEVVGNALYTLSPSGISKWDLNANEIWSTNTWCDNSCVDSQGQVIYSGIDSLNNTIFRKDINGVSNFSDSTMNANIIKADAWNNFYVLSYGSFPGKYKLEKYLSNGQKQWTFQQLPNSLPFGDLSAQIQFDNHNDVLLIGLSDSIYKISKTGSLIWSLPMNGMDSYIVDSKMRMDNHLIIAGSVFNVSTQLNDVKFSKIDNQATQVWTKTYANSNAQQFFLVGLAENASGVYGLINYNQNTRIVKFSHSENTTNSYADFCVDSVWYDTANSQLINIRVKNNGSTQLNYPSIQLISPTGTTVSNFNNDVTYFAHIPNATVTYTDTILTQGISDFSNYTFRMFQFFGNAVFTPAWCLSTGLSELMHSASSNVFPNPSSGIIALGNLYRNQHIQIQSAVGEIVMSGFFEKQIDLTGLANGIYILRNQNGSSHKFILAR
jgi:hypothetical protein